MSKVNTEHPEYQSTAQLRRVFSDVCAGTMAMRDADSAYLPKFPAEANGSHRLRIDTATLLNITAKTRESLCGLVFQKDLTLDGKTPKEMINLAENIDNQGNHLNVFARDLFEDSFDGWSLILVDSPTAAAADLGEQKAMGLRPYWVGYKASDVVNWDYQINPVSKRKELSLLVLRECVTQMVEMFERKTMTQYRVFRLDGTSVIWELWVEDDGETLAAEKTFTKKESGVLSKQTQIPVAIVGELGARPPLMDLCYKNIEHYQTYSDYKSIIHKTCVPMLYTINLESDPANLAIGGDILWKLGTGGSMGFAEPSGSSIEKTEKCLENIKVEMGMLGLAMLASNKTSGDVTATETMLDSIQETSALQVRATQLKDALELAFGFTSIYLGQPQTISVELGATWAQLVISPQELSALSSLVDLGQLSLESFVWYLHKGGKLPPDIDAAKELERIQKNEDDAAMTEPARNAGRMPNEKEADTKAVA